MKKGENNSIAHIVPESLGGQNSPIGQLGVTCNACNQYFGQKVESKALHSFPFIGYRVFCGIPSKKKSMPIMASTTGDIQATGQTGIITIDPRTEELGKLVHEGKVTQLRIIAEVTQPLAVCRMLLKIGLEQLGKHFYEEEISERVAAARNFARKPRRGESWWFMLRSSPEAYIRSNTQHSQSIEIIEHDNILISVVHMAGFSTMIALEPNTLPPTNEDISEPDFRVIISKC